LKNKNILCPYKKISVFYNSCLKTFGSHLEYKKSVINMGTKLYYKVPGYLKEMDNCEAVKTELKSFLLFHGFFPQWRNLSPCNV